MIITLQKLLIKKYPALLPNSIDIKCGNGWYKLLDKLFSDILDACPAITITNIKVISGGLRVYTKDDNQEAYRLIRQAENDSEYLCTYCGEMGNRITKTANVQIFCKTHRTSSRFYKDIYVPRNLTLRKVKNIIKKFLLPKRAYTRKRLAKEYKINYRTVKRILIGGLY